MSFCYALLVILASALGASSAFAAPYGMAGCGVGSLAFGDQPGKIQIVAATLNNIISPQTSGITSGTSNCTEEGSREEAALFITVNEKALRNDISRGNGETLNTLAQILKCEDSGRLGNVLRKNYQNIFPASDTPADQVNQSIDETIRRDQELVKSCKIYS